MGCNMADAYDMELLPRRIRIIDEAGDLVPLADVAKTGCDPQDICVQTLAEKTAWVQQQSTDPVVYEASANEWEVPTVLDSSVQELPVVTCKYLGVTPVTGPDVIVTSPANDGPGTLRQILGSPLSNVHVKPAPNLGPIQLLEDIVTSSLSTVKVSGFFVKGGGVRFSGFSNLEVCDNRFYQGVVAYQEGQEGPIAKPINIDSAAFVSGSRFRVHHNAFAFGLDGNVDFQSVRCGSVHNNIEMFGTHPARTSAAVSSEIYFFENFRTHNGSRLNAQTGKYKAENEITYNHSSRQYTASGNGTQFDIIGNVNHAGPDSSHGGQGVLCDTVPVQYYESGNQSYDAAGNPITWTVNANCGPPQSSEINHWLPCSTGLPSMAEVGTPTADCLQQAAKDMYTNLNGLVHPLGGLALQGQVMTPADVYDFVNDTCIVPYSGCSVIPGKWSYDFAAKEITLSFGGAVDGAYTALTSSTTYNFRLLEVESVSNIGSPGHVLWGANNVALGSDLSLATPLPGFVPGVIKTGSIVSGTPSDIVIDVTNLYGSVPGPQRAFRVEITLNCSPTAYFAYQIPL